MTRRGLSGIWLFGLVSLGLHAAAFGLFARPGAPEAAGEGGEAVLSLVASDAALAALVEDWETAEAPPELAPPELTPPPAPPPPEAPPALPEMAPRPMPAPLALALPETAPEPPPETPPPPKPQPEPEPEPAPKAEKKPAKPAAKPSAARPAQRAQGAGGGSARGNQQPGAVASASAGQIRSAVAEWGAAIRARVERHRRAPELGPGQGGRVTLRLNVARDGALQGVSVVKSSGDARVDRAALTAVRRAGRFPPAPSVLGKPSYGFNLPVRIGN
jgi:protein TonB